MSAAGAADTEQAFADQALLLEKTGCTRPVIFDVGANRGQTVTRYRSCLPGAEIHCFEPFPEAVQALREKYDGDPAVTVIDRGVADTTGVKKLFINHRDPTNSLLPRPDSGRRYYPARAGAKTEIEVDVITLDDYCRESGVTHLHVLKLDIQGGELMALRGAAGLLGDGKVPIIFTEIQFVPLYQDSPQFQDICLFLEPFGYTVFNLYNLKHASNGQLKYGDAIFVSAAAREKVLDRFPEEP